ncbi:hypothetical protein BDD12DRAFT_800999 [Trichophaea hybrida]|nr:hypothetical protein BDD12DRAFT_800999 [Trichophaea hybrida]
MQSGATIDHHHTSFTTQSPASPDIPTQHGSLHSGNVGGSVSTNWPGYGGIGPDDVKQSSTSPAKANRIAQYEAMTTSPSYGGGFDAGFIVTKTNWTGKALGDSPITRFPNEVLIHTLSFLEPSALLAASLISKRFHALVNSPHAWRSAFVRFFPPPRVQLDDHGSPLASQDRRYFTRLHPVDTRENAWRKEYIQRTKLLRKLGRGNHRDLVVTYPARTGEFSVSHMAASFTPNGIRAVHASLESQLVTASDPTIGKIEKRQAAHNPLWNFDFVPDFRRVRYDHPDYEVANDMNVNWVMDISEELGWIMGENVPDGRCFVHPYSSLYIGEGVGDASTGVYIQPGTGHPHESSAANRYGFKPLVTCVWIAKKRSACESTGAAIIVGNSRGYIRVFSIGFTKSSNDLKPITSYCISPGIPIVQIKVDEDFLPRRLRQKRPWLVVINALGEVHYLREIPKPGVISGWRMIPQTSRIPTPIYNEVFPDQQQEHEQRTELLNMDYFNIKLLWEGCHMDWFVEVDWAGANIIAGRAGTESSGSEYHQLGTAANIPVLKRYHLRKVNPDRRDKFVRKVVNGESSSEASRKKSVFGSGEVDMSARSRSVTLLAELPDNDENVDGNINSRDEWTTTTLYMPNSFTRITAYSMDNSHLARLTVAEDPTLQEGSPGGGGRLFAVGTNTGSIFVFSIRPTSVPESSSHMLEAVELPIRTIHTDSPQITTLAVSSLVIVHGGDDGLIQAWDPLGSTGLAVRTIHSRFSARARRRLEQHVGAQAMTADNQFAARCLILDPDPTNLRGVVALGTFIRYWSLSATDTGPKKARKAARGGGRSRGGATPSRTKGAIRKVIYGDEKAMRLERERERKEAAEMERRYGISSGRTALNEEEMLAYAQMISREAFEIESSGRSEVGSSLSGRSTDTVTPEGSVEGSAGMGFARAVDPDNANLELALRLSLQDVEVCEMQPENIEEVWEDAGGLLAAKSGPSSYKYWSTPASPSPSKSPQDRKSPKKKGWQKLSLDAHEDAARDEGYGSAKGGEMDMGGGQFEDDLELAIRLSLQEQEGKGKGLA